MYTIAFKVHDPDAMLTGDRCHAGVRGRTFAPNRDPRGIAALLHMS